MFPLPLTSMEEYLLSDDHPGYPMTGIFRVRLKGFLDSTAFLAALDCAVRRHPLLSASIQKRSFGRPHWVHHANWRPAVLWHAPININGFPQIEHLDPTKEPAVRFWVSDRDDGNDLFIQAHHCCSDAQGMSTVIEDLLIGYANIRDHSDIPLKELDPQYLLQRSGAKPFSWSFLKKVHKQLVGLVGVREFLMRTPATLSCGRYETGGDTAQNFLPNPYIFRLTPEQTTKLFATARSCKANLNELLIRDLFIACHAWRSRHALGSEHDWLRFSIPLSLRTAAHERMPMANSFSMVFLDRQKSDCSDSVQLLASIADQLQVIRRCELRSTFLLSLDVTRMLPGGLSRMVRDDTCYATSCFSNVGKVLAMTPLPRNDGKIVAGDVMLDSIDFVIPVRPHMHAAFCAYIYANRLHILMNCDPSSLPDYQARELMDMLVGQILSTASVI